MQSTLHFGDFCVLYHFDECFSFLFLFCSEHFSFVLTSMEGDRRFGYCRRMLVRHCIIHAHTLAPFMQICFPSLLEQTLDYLKSTASLVSGDALICTKRSVNVSRSPSRSMLLSTQVLDQVEERRQIARAAMFTFLKAINENPFPRPVSLVSLPFPFLTFSLCYACTCISVLCFCDIHYYYCRGVP